MGIIDYLSKLVWEHLEGEMDRMKVSTMKSVTKDRYAERQKSMLRPVHDMAQFVTDNFDFRHNVVRDLYEYRRKGSDDGWKLVDNRQMNSINCRIQDDGEIFTLCVSILTGYAAVGMGRLTISVISPVVSVSRTTVSAWCASGYVPLLPNG